MVSRIIGASVACCWTIMPSNARSSSIVRITAERLRLGSAFFPSRKRCSIYASVSLYTQQPAKMVCRLVEWCFCLRGVFVFASVLSAVSAGVDAWGEATLKRGCAFLSCPNGASLYSFEKMVVFGVSIKTHHTHVVLNFVLRMSKNC